MSEFNSKTYLEVNRRKRFWNVDKIKIKRKFKKKTDVDIQKNVDFRL